MRIWSKSYAATLPLRLRFRGFCLRNRPPAIAIPAHPAGRPYAMAVGGGKEYRIYKRAPGIEAIWDSQVSSLSLWRGE